MANVTMDIFLHKPFSILLSNFPPYPVHQLNTKVVGHAPEGSEQISTVNFSKIHPFQSIEEEKAAEKVNISDEDSS